MIEWTASGIRKAVGREVATCRKAIGTGSPVAFWTGRLERARDALRTGMRDAALAELPKLAADRPEGLAVPPCPCGRTTCPTCERAALEGTF